MTSRAGMRAESAPRRYGPLRERDATLLILGPLCIRGPDGEVGLGGYRPRRLLAALALHAGEDLSADRLIDAVWGESPARTARQNLHTYLWSLRRSFADAGGGLTIGAGPAGYRLDVAPGTLDWGRFRDLVEAGEGCLRRDPVAAGGLFRQALELWRGSPVADVAELLPDESGRVAAMEEARVTALEQRIEADLAAGLGRELVAELAELAGAHPFREQLRAHQMVALYRCGRRAEALSVFHRFRRELADEMGVDPGQKLRSLFEGMLRADPRLDRHAVSPMREARPAGQRRHGETLGQRAARDEARAFQGRSAELAQILGIMAGPGMLPRVVRLHGPAGIGKTAFAYALSRSCTARGWSAVIIDSRDFRHDAASLSEIVAARCRQAWEGDSGRPLLLVLDTFEEMTDVERDLWDIVLPGISGPVLVLLSGRHRAAIRSSTGRWHDLVDDVELAGLSEAEARRLITLHGVGDPRAAAKVIAFAAGNPLFLTVAAQHARSAPTAELDLYGEVAQPLIGLMTREIADPHTRDLLDAASLVRTASQELLSEMAGHDVSGAFASLCRLSFVRVVPHGARVHDLVRESMVADLRWRAPGTWQAMRRRAYEYLARQARSAPDPGPYVQELLHLAAGASVTARFYASADRAEVRVRPVRSDDLPRLAELCQTGVTRAGYPPDERARQLLADFPIARRHFAVSEDDCGHVTGFAYTIGLNAVTWPVAAKTRRAFFAALPEAEMASIRAAAEDAPQRARLIAAATHLPGYDHVNSALREYLFARAWDRRSVASVLTSYHLLTADCLELPEIVAAGLTRRTTSIALDGCLVDEWLLRFGNSGFTGWIAEALGIDPVEGAPQPSARDLSSARNPVPSPQGAVKTDRRQHG